MKKTFLIRYRILTSLVVVLLSGVSAYASSQWPFPSEAYSRDVAYVHHLLTRMAEDPRFNNTEKMSDAELHKQIGSKYNSGTDQLILNQESIDDQEPYDYWSPLSKNVLSTIKTNREFLTQPIGDKL